MKPSPTTWVYNLTALLALTCATASCPSTAGAQASSQSPGSASPDLPVIVSDNLQADHRQEYRAEGPVTWEPGRLLVRPQGQFTVPSNGAPSGRFELTWSIPETLPPAPTSPPPATGSTRPDCTLTVRLVLPARLPILITWSGNSEGVFDRLSIDQKPDKEMVGIPRHQVGLPRGALGGLWNVRWEHGRLVVECRGERWVDAYLPGELTYGPTEVAATVTYGQVSIAHLELRGLPTRVRSTRPARRPSAMPPRRIPRCPAWSGPDALPTGWIGPGGCCGVSKARASKIPGPRFFPMLTGWSPSRPFWPECTGRSPPRPQPHALEFSPGVVRLTRILTAWKPCPGSIGS